jgi:hypothetical protein
MVEMLTRMFGDTLWIYTAIAGSLIGAAFLAWFRNTHAALWLMGKFDLFLDSLVDKFGWDFLQDDPEAWRKRYPKVTKKVDELEARIRELESMAHPSRELEEFSAWPEIELRLKNLEEGRKAKIIRQKGEKK